MNAVNARPAANATAVETLDRMTRLVMLSSPRQASDPLVAVRIPEPHRDVTSVRHRDFLEKPHRVSISSRESRRRVGFSNLESPFRRTAQPALAKSTGSRGLENPNRLAAILVG